MYTLILYHNRMIRKIIDCTYISERNFYRDLKDNITTYARVLPSMYRDSFHPQMISQSMP